MDGMEPSQNQPLLALLPDKTSKALTAIGDKKRFDDGQTIHGRGSQQLGLSIILSGRVRFGVFNVDGDYYQTGLLSEGHCFGEATLFANMPRAYHAEAVGDTVILAIGKKKFEKALDEHPDLARALLSTLTNRLYEALDFTDDLRRLPLDANIAKMLFRIEKIGGFAGGAIPIRQIDLAYSLGVSRVSAGKSLDRLQCDGLIKLGYREINILDRRGLANIIATGLRE